MKTWKRAAKEIFCGNCRASIYAEQPYLEIVPNGGWASVKSAKIRCRDCAGEPVPDLPALPPRKKREPMPIVGEHGMSRFNVKAMPFDWKARASGE